MPRFPPLPPVALPALVALLLAPLVGAAAAGDFHATLAPGASPSFEGEEMVAELVRATPGEEAVWSLSTSLPQLNGTITVRGFDVARPQQVMIEVDPHFDLHEHPAGDLARAPHGARWLNYTAPLPELEIALTFPVNGSAELRIARDVAPPRFTLGPVQNLTHQAFYLETTTDEFASSDLVLEPSDGGEAIHNPIGTRALQQRFPVQGLHADTPYRWHIDYRDGAGNAARTPDFELRTLPAPRLPAPAVTAREPAPNATLDGPVALVALNYTGMGPRSLDDVSVFVDKTPTHHGIALLPGRVEVRLAAPLGAGPHTIGFEVTGAEGGTAIERWAFEVRGAEPRATPDFGALLAVAGVVAAAVLAAPCAASLRRSR